MKQLLSLFLFLLPCLALAQYPTNGNQKITLGEQTTADGLIYRGLAADTTLTAKSDTAAYFVLDTVNINLYTYKASATGRKWRQLGADTASIAYVNNYGTQTVNGAKTFTSAVTATRFNPTSADTSGTGMYLSATNKLGFSTNNSNKMNIDANGNLILGQLNSSLQSGGTGLTLFGTTASEIKFLNNSTGSTTTDGTAFVTSGLNYTMNNREAGFFTFSTSNTQRMIISATGNIGIGVVSPGARLHLVAGTSTTGTSPLKFSSGTNVSPAEAGAMEFDGTNLFFSPSTTRHTVNHGLVFTATLDFASTNAQSSNDQTIAATGAALGDVVSLGVPNAAVNANTSYSAWVSAAGTVTVRFNNYSSGTVDPASALFKVFVTK
jgi:hypothetical protein